MKNDNKQLRGSEFFSKIIVSILATYIIPIYLVSGFTLVGLSPLIYLLARLFFLPAAWFVDGVSEQTLLDSVMAGLAATVFGVSIGIPVALWLNKRQQEDTDQKEQMAKDIELTDRQNKVLKLIKEELDYNKGQIEGRLTSDNEGIVTREVTITSPLKNHLWKALSDGGELQYIKNVNLLGLIADAYYYTDVIISLEARYNDSVLLTLSAVHRKHVQDSVIQNIEWIDRTALTIMTNLIAVIEKKLLSSSTSSHLPQSSQSWHQR